MNEYMENELENNDTQELIKKFEEVQDSLLKDIVYFDTDEMDIIIDYYLFHKNIDMAKLAWDYATTLYKDNKDIELKRAKIYFVEGKYLETINIFDKTETVKEEYIGIWAESLLHIGDIEGSDEMFRNFILDCDIEDILSVYLDITNLYILENQFDIAHKWIQEACEVIPNHADLYNEYGYYYDMVSEWEMSLEMYQKSLTIDPYKADTWGMMGTVHFKLQNMEAALDAFNFSLSINPDNLLTTIQKAHCLFNLNRYDEAKIEYNKYLEINDQDPISWCFYAECYENTEEYETAIKYYTKTLELDEDNVDALVGISTCYNEMDDYSKEAFKYAQLAYQKQNDNLEALVILGNIHLKNAFENDDKKEYQSALDFLLKAIEIEPNEAKLNMDVGNIYLQYSMFAKALIYYKKTYELDSSLDKILLLLAVAYYGTKDMDNWEKYFDMAKEVYPNAEEMFKSIFPDCNTLE